MRYEEVSNLSTDLNEVFVVPVGLQVVARLDGIDLFGSDGMNRSFIKALTKSKRTKSVVKKVESLVDKKQIIPCFLSKTILGFVTRKFFTPRSQRATVAFFEPVKTKKIYVLIDNNVNFFAHVSNNFIAAVTVHELMHMVASKKPTMFFNLFKPELTTYYKNLWRIIFSLEEDKIKDSDVEEVVSFIFRKLELVKKEITNSDLNKYFNILHSTFSSITTLEEDRFTIQLRDYIVAIKLFLRNFEVFFSIARKFSHILNPLYNSYKQSFGYKNLNILCIQELIYPSEVICICSEHGLGAKVTKSINQL